jgi:hypothetical protein
MTHELEIGSLIQALKEFPEDWHASATKSGDSIRVWDPHGPEYAFVFTDGRATQRLTDRRRARWQTRQNA